MNAEEIRAMEEKKIVSMMKDLYKELNELSLAIASGQESDYSKKSKIRKDIARMQTVLREKSLISEYVQSDDTLNTKVNGEK